MYKLVFFVPPSHLEVVKQALFVAGAGRQGNYDSCCWQVLGRGEFRPLDGSSPFLGTQGLVEAVDEYRVEMLCPDNQLTEIVAALRASHPYEEPAFDVWPLVSIE